MKKNKILLVLLLVIAMSFGTVVGAVAATNYETIQAILSYVRTVTIDGELTQFKDVNKNNVYPISYNGTTYLPIRGLAETFGFNVDYDEKTDRVIINTGISKSEDGKSVTITAEEYETISAFIDKYSKLEGVMGYAKRNYLYGTTDEILMEGALKGSIAALGDKYSEYLTPEEMEAMMQSTTGNFVGIGVQITVSDDNKILIISPIDGSPAQKAGLKAGDKIVAVNGVKYTGDQMTEASNVMKGEVNTPVTVTIEREENGKINTFDVEIIRALIKDESVSSEILENNIGYIKLSGFDEHTPRDFLLHLDTLEQKNIKGLVIDLRNNPGGLLDASSKISDVLIGESIITYTKTRTGIVENYQSDKDKISIPYVLIVNEGSASASEIMAGAVKDTKSGTIVGTKTFGKGIVQMLQYIGYDGSGIKMTVSQYFTPNGVNIHGIGIEPDVVVELNPDAKGIGPEYYEEDNQLQKAVEILKNK